MCLTDWPLANKTRTSYSRSESECNRFLPSSLVAMSGALTGSEGDGVAGIRVALSLGHAHGFLFVARGFSCLGRESAQPVRIP
jgi:hypothetical protein